jgi:isopenicillin N synthase-like dioxygenase
MVCPNSPFGALMPSIQVVDYRSPDAPEQFSRSLKETGFGVVSHHPVQQDLIDWAYQEWGKFFHSEEKHNFPFDAKSHTGFISSELSETAKGFEKKDLKEFFHLYNEGHCPPALRDKTMALKTQLTSLGGELLGWLQDHTPTEITDKLESPMPEFIEGSDLHLFRLIHYPPLTGNEPEGAVRAAAHGDINLLTLLPAATAEGLQAQLSNGDWMDVPINPNWIVVNAGDMLEECTEHYYPSTQHRVLNPTGEASKLSRLSMPLFFHPRNDIRLSDRHTAHSYRMERYKELGLDGATN